jgi:hypothetical protein
MVRGEQHLAIRGCVPVDQRGVKQHQGVHGYVPVNQRGVKQHLGVHGDVPVNHRGVEQHLGCLKTVFCCVAGFGLLDDGSCNLNGPG